MDSRELLQRWFQAAGISNIVVASAGSEIAFVYALTLIACHLLDPSEM